MLEEMEKLDKLIDEVIKMMLEKNVLLNDIDYIAGQIKLKLEFIKALT